MLTMFLSACLLHTLNMSKAIGELKGDLRVPGIFEFFVVRERDTAQFIQDDF